MDDTLRPSDETVRLRRGIEQLNTGDSSVRGELLNIACERLMQLTERLQREFRATGQVPSTEDVFHGASLRLYQSLHDTPIRDVRHFYQIATVEIRRELIELCRYCRDLRRDDADDTGRSGQRHGAQGDQADRVAAEELRRWAQLHDSIDALPELEREVFQLVWYHEMTREQAASLLGLPLAEVRRLWRAARLNLHDLLGDDRLPTNSRTD
jgi:RNA polymerase sigma-70 factor (ECF subfamily)